LGDRTFASITAEEVAEIAAEWLREAGATTTLDKVLGRWLRRLDHGSFYWELHGSNDGFADWDQARVRAAVLDAAVSLPTVEGEWNLARQRAVATRIADCLFGLGDGVDDVRLFECPCGEHELWFDPITGSLRQVTAGRGHLRSTPRLLVVGCDSGDVEGYLSELLSDFPDDYQDVDDDELLADAYPDEAAAFREVVLSQIFDALVARPV
jgi:hypothetical protein